MNEFINTMLGLDGPLRFGAGDTTFGFERPLSAAAWALAAVVAITIAWAGYWRLDAPRTPRVALATLRTLLLLLVRRCFAGPRLERQRSTTETDWLAVLVDRSASLTVHDAPGGITRDDQARAAITTATDALARLDESKRILWLGFDGGAYEIERDDAGMPTLAEPDGRRTSLGVALDRTLDRLAGRPVSGLIMLSDGRSSDAPSRTALRRLESERIPVHVVPLGSRDAQADLALRRVAAPGLAFVDDTVPVTIEFTVSAGGRAMPEGVIELVDSTTGAVLDTARFDEADFDADANTDIATPRTGSVVLRHTPTDPAEARWTVRLRPEGGDLVTANNERSFSLRIDDTPLRVLYVDGSPRWENRYLKNLLRREGSITSSSLLLSATRRYQQEGDVVVTNVPATEDAWREYDVVIIGDLRAELFGREQLEALRRHVINRGAGLLWIAGPGSTPAGWFGTPLADLLPITAGTNTGNAGVPVYTLPIAMGRRPEAERLGVLELANDGGWPDVLSAAGAGWNLLRWAQRIEPDRIKPTATALASAAPVQSNVVSDETTPIVLTMRVGKGVVGYVGTDEIWRWRYGRGEDLPERFWLPLIRMLGRESLARSGQPARLTVEPEQAVVGQPVRITVELIDQQLAEAGVQSVAVELRSGVGRPIDIELLPEGNDPSRTPTYAATWLAGSAGTFEAVVTEPLLGGIDLARPFEVVWPDDELRRPQADHAALERLAAATGGKVLSTDDLANLDDPDLLPNRARVIAGPIETRTLWDTPLMFAVLILLAAMEWAGRRLIRLA